MALDTLTRTAAPERALPAKAGKGLRSSQTDKAEARSLLRVGAVPMLAAPWGPARPAVPETPAQDRARYRALLAQVTYVRVDGEYAPRMAHPYFAECKDLQGRLTRLYAVAKRAAHEWAGLYAPKRPAPKA